MKYANLHLHSTYSDGVLTPMELCQKAKELGYGALSLTDHNTDSGWADFKAACEATGMDYILGQECTARGDGYDFHIVAYDFDPTAPAMAEYIKNEEDTMMSKTKAQFDACIEKGLFGGITWQEVLDKFPNRLWICNEQVFATLVEKTEMTQADYWPFIKNFNGQRQVSYTATNRKYTAKEMIKVIRDAGGIASLAHPHNQTQHLPWLHDLGLMCVEYDHPDIDCNDGVEAYKFAKEHGMYLAGGTDHTGLLANHTAERGYPASFDPRKNICAYDKDVRNGVTKEEFEALKNRIYG